ncbi:uncharacterized protein LOC114426975 [Parambassis ranga]|uniref:Uncharacterized protein LOC114426975 n=1 Tax=Parambassis ranga TaxID=210632 RepID=A0A6P7H5M9_9TELE|nr:uncharacterized protein LOC114426975 [Parambassis ranga]
MLLLLLLSTVLPLFLYKSTAYTTAQIILLRPNEVNIPPLQLEATPDYPVVAGQSVVLRCSSSILPLSITSSWHHLQNQTWKNVSVGRELILTEPRQSGLYRCQDGRMYSQNHTVYIISVRATVGENLGVAAFILSLLALIIITIVFWTGYQKLRSLSTSGSAAKGFPQSDPASKRGLPQNDQDVYMNYTSDNQAYTDLDPTSMTGHNVYSVCHEK